jgi:hypothetical protein
MSDATGNPLPEDEMLARFVFFEKGWIRPDNTVKQDAFIPPKDLQLSVTRHAGISIEKLNDAGKSVAAKRSLQFCGRADIQTRMVVKNALKAVAWPLADDANHAHIIGWPTDKASQKTIAQELAAAAKFVPA